MKDKVFGILKHSTIYSFGYIAQKGMGIITLPIYAYYITKSEFGVFAILDIIIILFAEFLSLGQANSVIYFNSVSEYRGKHQSIFYTITVTVFSISLIFVGLTIAANFATPALFDSKTIFAGYLPLITLISFARALNSIFFNKLRADDQSRHYTALTLVKILITIGSVILFVALLHLSFVGILYAYLVSEVSLLLVFMPMMISKMEFSFDNAIMKGTIKYGAPLIFGAVGAHILNLSDRFLIQHFYNSSYVGTYDFGYRIAGVIQMILIMPFNQALLPSTYREYKRPGDTRYYSKLMTYMCFVLIWGGLALALFGDLAVYVMGQNRYLGAEAFVPIIILAYIFSSMRNVASIGIMLSGKTIYIGALTITAGIINIILNTIFLPVYGVITAAYTTLISFILFFFATKLISDKYYKISYEAIKLIKLFLVSIVLFNVSELFKTGFFLLDAAVKTITILLFPFIMFVLNFYEEIELKTIKDSFRKLKSPADIKNILNNLLNK
jgi:O-antigen/teichoic acid export membrane protein